MVGGERTDHALFQRAELLLHTLISFLPSNTVYLRDPLNELLETKLRSEVINRASGYLKALPCKVTEPLSRALHLCCSS